MSKKLDSVNVAQHKSNHKGITVVELKPKNKQNKLVYSITCACVCPCGK